MILINQIFSGYHDNKYLKWIELHIRNNLYYYKYASIPNLRRSFLINNYATKQKT